MEAILLKAGGFLLIIFIGYLFKRIGVFSVGDSQFLTKLIMRITLPAAIFCGFQGLIISPTLLLITVLGMVLSFICIGAALLCSRHKTQQEKAFFMISGSGYNIGNFAIPFTQAFFSKDALVVVCMFDVGNAIMCFGITFALANMIASGKSGYGPKEAMKTLFSSVPFMTHLTMITLSALQIRFPQSVYTVVGMFGSANSFLAMLLIGILFSIKMEKSDARNIMEVLLLRVTLSVIFSSVIYYLLPLPMMMKQVLVIIVFSPILSIAPVLTERVGYHKSVSAVANSIAIPISMIIMTILLIIFHI